MAAAMPSLSAPTVCSICVGLLNDPVLLPCKHIVCRTCVKRSTGYCVMDVNSPEVEPAAVVLCPVHECNARFRAVDLLGSRVIPVPPIVSKYPVPSTKGASHGAGEPSTAAATAEAEWAVVKPKSKKRDKKGTETTIKESDAPEDISDAVYVMRDLIVVDPAFTGDVTQLPDMPVVSVLDLIPTYEPSVAAVVERKRVEALPALCSFCEASASDDDTSTTTLAEVHCVMCGYLCTTCARRHAKVPYTMAHPTVPSAAVSTKGGIRFCALHVGKVLRGVCTHAECDNALICEDCLNFGEHFGHKPQLLEAYEASIASEVADQIDSLHNHSNEVSDAMHEVEKEMSAIRHTHAEMEADLESTRAALLKAVNDRVNSMQDTLKLIFRTRQESLQLQHLALQTLRIGNDAIVATARAQMAAKAWCQTAEVHKMLKALPSIGAIDLEAWASDEVIFNLDELHGLVSRIGDAGTIHMWDELPAVTNIVPSCARVKTDNISVYNVVLSWDAVEQPPAWLADQSLCVDATLEYKVYKNRELVYEGTDPTCTFVEPLSLRAVELLVIVQAVITSARSFCQMESEPTAITISVPAILDILRS